MTERINILEVSASDLDRRYFIDCPVQTMLEGEKLIRMQIPQELAKYIYGLQKRNKDLQMEISKLSDRLEVTKP